MDELEISGKRYISTARAAKENKYHSDYIGQLVRGGKVVGQKVGRSWYVNVESLNDYLEKGESTKPALPTVAPAALVQQEPVEEQIVEPVVEASVVHPTKVVEKKMVEDAEDPFQKFVRKLHIIKAIGEQTERAAPIVVKKEEPKIEVPAEDSAAPLMDEEVFIPIKLERSVPHIKAKEPEDSFYKIPKSGLTYIASRAIKRKTDDVHEVAAVPITTASPLRAIAEREEKHTRHSMRVGALASLVMIVGILSLGGGILLSYYLHSATTVNASGQASGLIFSQ